MTAKQPDFQQQGPLSGVRVVDMTTVVMGPYATQILAIPVAEVSALNDVIDDPHLRAVGLLSKEEHPTEGSLLSLGQSVHWSSHAVPGVRHAPTLGEHNVEVLREIGYADPEIQQLIASGVAASRGV